MSRLLRVPSPDEYQRMTRGLRIAVAEGVLAATDAARARRATIATVEHTLTTRAAEAILATLTPDPAPVVARRRAELIAATTHRRAT